MERSVCAVSTSAGTSFSTTVVRGQAATWSFVAKDGREPVTVSVRGSFTANNSEVLRDAASIPSDPSDLDGPRNGGVSAYLNWLGQA